MRTVVRRAAEADRVVGLGRGLDQLLHSPILPVQDLAQAEAAVTERTQGGVQFVVGPGLYARPCRLSELDQSYSGAVQALCSMDVPASTSVRGMAGSLWQAECAAGRASQRTQPREGSWVPGTEMAPSQADEADFAAGRAEDVLIGEVTDLR